PECCRDELVGTTNTGLERAVVQVRDDGCHFRSPSSCRRVQSLKAVRGPLLLARPAAPITRPLDLPGQQEQLATNPLFSDRAENCKTWNAEIFLRQRRQKVSEERHW